MRIVFLVFFFFFFYKLIDLLNEILMVKVEMGKDKTKYGALGL